MKNKPIQINTASLCIERSFRISIDGIQIFSLAFCICEKNRIIVRHICHRTLIITHTTTFGTGISPQGIVFRSGDFIFAYIKIISKTSIHSRIFTSTSAFSIYSKRCFLTIRINIDKAIKTEHRRRFNAIREFIFLST